MQTKSLLEHLLCDEVSLRYYMEGNIVSCRDVQRRLFEMGRKDDIHVPDHYYRLLKESKRLRVYTLHNSKKAVTAD